MQRNNERVLSKIWNVEWKSSVDCEKVENQFECDAYSLEAGYQTY